MATLNPLDDTQQDANNKEEYWLKFLKTVM
jgi:hypothetical protein